LNKISRVLVTGGAGFIGSHVVDSLVSNDYEVRVIDNLSTGKLENISKHVEDGKISFVKGDLREAGFVRKSVHDVDAVIHLAAITSVPFSISHPSTTYSVNVDGTINLLNSCLGSDVRKFIYISTCAVYGESSYLPIDEVHPTNPISPYAASKLAAEQQCRIFDQMHKLSMVVLRLFNVYGSRQDSRNHGVIARFVERAKRGLPLIIYGDGSQTRDFVNVEDVTDAILEALRNGNGEGKVFNIAYGKATSLNDLAKTVLKSAATDLELVYEKPRAGDLRQSFADISEARKFMGFSPRISLEDGLRPLLVDGHENQ
jgi:UDP-glucose 4-epimerase